jgi:hypothetical protein
MMMMILGDCPHHLLIFVFLIVIDTTLSTHTMSD